ncbi:MAG TPA: ATP-binding protein [Rhodocyclaceae bacterium]
MDSSKLTGDSTIHDPARGVVAGAPLLGGADVRLLLRLRAVAIAGQSLALLVSGLLIDIELPFLALSCGVAVLAGLNVYTWLRLRNGARRDELPLHWLDERAFFYQVLVDIAVLTYLLYFAGGPENPFHGMFLLPLTVAAAALPWRYVWRVVLASVTGYTFVALKFVPFTIPPALGGPHEVMMFGQWVNHVLLALLVTYFIVRITQGLRARDRLLEDAHIRELRNSCAVAVGSVAAGVAHELGTPLSTIQVVLREMRRTHADNPAIATDLDVVSDQLGECRSILGGIRDYVQALRNGDKPVPVDTLVDDVAERFLDIRPGVNLSKSLDGPLPAPLIVPDLALQQAMINLLNNAADVSPHAVTVEARWTTSQLVIRVLDRGPGISPALAERLGKVLVSTKAPDAGNGLGLFLTNVTMSRLGGRLKLFNHAEGGACAELVLPVGSAAKPE